jgi:hypothetical protein
MSQVPDWAALFAVHDLEETFTAARPEPEPFCLVCGGPVGIFLGHGDRWWHFTGSGTAANPVKLLYADHEPEVEWR